MTTPAAPRAVGGAVPATIVVKVGGEVLQDDAQRLGFVRNVRDLVVGRDAPAARVVVVHGGGPQASALQERLGLVPRKVAGQRVTSDEDLRAVHQAVCGEVNVALVCGLLKAGVRAFGFHGASGGLLVAKRRPPVAAPGHDGLVDYGAVGDIHAVDVELLVGLCALGVVPVIATLGVDPTSGASFNVNADTSAAQIASALRADLLLLVTAVGGVFGDVRDPASRLPVLTPRSARARIADGTIAGGMIPKVEEALTILDAGVGSVSILGAMGEGTFRSAWLGDGRHGTRLAPDT